MIERACRRRNEAKNQGKGFSGQGSAAGEIDLSSEGKIEIIPIWKWLLEDFL